MMLKLKLVLAILLGGLLQSQAQTTTQTNQNPKTGVRITTRITPLKPLAEQVADIERMLAEARQNPDRVADGTVAKYEQALARKKEELAAEQAQD